MEKCHDDWIEKLQAEERALPGVHTEAGRIAHREFYVLHNVGPVRYDSAVWRGHHIIAPVRKRRRLLIAGTTSSSWAIAGSRECNDRFPRNHLPAALAYARPASAYSDPRGTKDQPLIKQWGRAAETGARGQVRSRYRKLVTNAALSGERRRVAGDKRNVG